jgi:hypothetical protein
MKGVRFGCLAIVVGKSEAGSSLNTNSSSPLALAGAELAGRLPPA